MTLDAHHELQLNPDYPEKKSLWIFDRDVECAVPSAEFLELIERIRQRCPSGTPKQKAALLAARGIHFGIMQLFCEESFIDGFPFKFRAFLSYTEAMDWLSIA